MILYAFMLQTVQTLSIIHHSSEGLLGHKNSEIKISEVISTWKETTSKSVLLSNFHILFDTFSVDEKTKNSNVEELFVYDCEFDILASDCSFDFIFLIFPNLKLLEVKLCQDKSGEGLLNGLTSPFDLAAKFNTFKSLVEFRYIHNPSTISDAHLVNISRKFPNLRSLDISGNTISDVLCKFVSDESMIYFRNLKSLKLSGLCNAIDIRPNFVFNYPALESLDLSNTAIREIINNTSRTNNVFHPLLKLNMSGTGIIRIPTRFLYIFPFLKTLDMSNNCIESLPDFFAESVYSDKDVFHRLKCLNLSRNKIERVSFSFLSNFPTLVFLNLSENNISIFHEPDLSVESLIELNISRNSFSEIPYEFIEKLPGLEILDISNNLIISFPGHFSETPCKIKCLAMSKDQKDKIPKGRLKFYPPIKVVD